MNCIDFIIADPNPQYTLKKEKQALAAAHDQKVENMRRPPYQHVGLLSDKELFLQNSNIVTFWLILNAVL